MVQPTLHSPATAGRLGRSFDVRDKRAPLSAPDMPMTVRQLSQASCTLACFEAFLAQNGKHRTTAMAPQL
jgi:hypothetical protein